MVCLIIENGERRGVTVPLVRGPNLLGRAEDCSMRLHSPAVSGRHCEVFVSEFGVRVRDLGSSNGTFVDGVPVQEAELRDGQILMLGDVRLRALVPPVQIAIPELSPPEPTGPAVTVDGLPACQNHRAVPATHFCAHCDRTFCPECVKPIRLTGGKTRLLCPACSNLCQPLEARGEAVDTNSLKHRVLRSFRLAFDFRRPRRRSR